MDNAQGDFAAAFSKILEDPEALKSVIGIASKLKSSGILDGEDRKERTELSYSAPDEAYGGTGGGKAAIPAGRTAAGTGDDRKELLRALRPYISKERREKLDAILRILDLLETARLIGGADTGGFRRS